MKFNVKDSVSRWTSLDRDVKLYSTNGKEKTVETQNQLEEVLLFDIEIECDTLPEDAFYDEIIIKNIVRSLVILFGEKCLMHRKFFLEKCERHFLVMKIKDIKVISFEKYYKVTTKDKHKETSYTSPMINLTTENAVSL